MCRITVCGDNAFGPLSSLHSRFMSALKIGQGRCEEFIVRDMECVDYISKKLGFPEGDIVEKEPKRTKTDSVVSYKLEHAMLYKREGFAWPPG